MATYKFSSSAVPTCESEEETAVVRRVFRRLMWFLFLATCISYLDRINISFAALSMNAQLGLTATAYGFALTIFYIGYVACEIPSNMLLAKFGARFWISRIMITWGLASTATMLVHSATSLYIIRFIVGITEAGFSPGVLLFMTFFFPRACRARATAYFVAAQALAVAGGSILSGFILRIPPWLGVDNWRWLFLIEGMPATLLGIIGLFYLADNPSRAKWLSGAEKVVLKQVFDRENAGAPPVRDKARDPLWRQLLSRDVLLLGIAYFGLVTTFSTNAAWVPLIVQGLMKKLSVSQVAFASAIPATLAILVLPFWGRSSDRRQERVWHTIAALVLAALGWFLVGAARATELRFLGLILCSIGSWCGMTCFWTMPPQILSDEAKAAGIALVSTIGLLASAASPTIIGVLRDLTGSFRVGVYYASTMLMISGAIILFVTSRRGAGAVLRYGSLSRPS